jgi:hypothetical protein
MTSVDGDITRSTFDPAKAYTSVRLQQGRVPLDADANENTDILVDDARVARVDVVGRAGGPVGDCGFEVVAAGAGLEVRPGTYYLDGIRVDSGRTDTLIDLPAAVGSVVAVHLHVWERTITAVEDPHLREVALGGPDTAFRTQVTWAVAALEVTSGVPSPTCGTTFPEWDTLVAPSNGTLQLRTDPTAAATGPCLVPESAGYRGLENRTYRVQVHEGNVDHLTGEDTGTTPTLLWSADNGSTLAAWTSPPSGVDVQVDRLGPGGVDGFGRGDLVELSTDGTELAGAPGLLAVVADIVGDTTLRLGPLAGGTVLELTSDLVGLYATGAHPKVRRWDGGGPLTFGVDGWGDLGSSGLQARLGAGRLRTGDVWVAAVRTAILPGTGNRQLEWPDPVAGVPVPVLPHGPEHHRARLAVAVLGAGGWDVVSDCREQFAPLTDDLQFTMRGGDGQHAPADSWLPVPLTVGVTRGRTPAAHQPVRLQVTAGFGGLSPVAPAADGTLPGGAVPETTVRARTDEDGLVHVWWRLGLPVPVAGPDVLFDPAGAQQVTAVLEWDSGADRHQPLTFTAIPVEEPVLVAAGGDGQLGRPGETLELALRARVSAGTQPAVGHRVRFEIESRMFGGAALDEITGGSLLATDNVQFTEPWPGGSRIYRAMVLTGEDGVAQVQWVLGTERGLTVQRVSATLMDTDFGIAQRVMFGAHLALASEVDWVPCRALGKVDDATVQEALDIYCRILGGRGTIAAGRLVGFPLELVELRPEHTLPLGRWTGQLILRMPWVLDADPPLAAVQACLSVTAEVPDAQFPPAERAVLLPGEVQLARREDGVDVAWNGTDPVSLLKPIVSAAPVRLRVAFLPSLLAHNAPAMPFHAAVTLAP